MTSRCQESCGSSKHGAQSDADTLPKGAFQSSSHMANLGTGEPSPSSCVLFCFESMLRVLLSAVVYGVCIERFSVAH